MELCTSNWDGCLLAITSLNPLCIITSVICILTCLYLVPFFIYLVHMVARQLTILSYLFRQAPKVDPKNHGGHLIAKVLKSHGVDNVFTLSGGHISPILVGAEKLGMLSTSPFKFYLS